MLVRVLIVAVTAPWIIIVGALRLVVGLVRLPWKLRAITNDRLVCPDGHPNSVMGRWSCRCGADYLGHVFGPCPVCGMPAGWVKCERCGLAIRSPWKDD